MQFRVFVEEGVLLASPDVRPNEYEVVSKPLLQRLCATGKNRIDTAYLITNLPTGLKHYVGQILIFCHKKINFCIPPTQRTAPLSAPRSYLIII